VIHTVGPVYDAHADLGDTLRSCYTRSVAVADEVGATTVAFPLISSGAFGWPLEDAVRQALSALRGAETSVEEARLVLFGSDTFATARRLFAA
jgi:O-acetyl-ADP-ribose deacetylase (regulator of RNase III)